MILSYLLESLKLLFNDGLGGFSESIFGFVLRRDLWRREDGDEFWNPAILENVFFFLKLEFDVQEQLRDWLAPVCCKSFQIDQVLG